MNKKSVLITILSLAAASLVVFLLLFFLSIPLGGRESVLSPVPLTVVGGLFAGISLFAGIVFFVRFRQGG